MIHLLIGDMNSTKADEITPMGLSHPVCPPFFLLRLPSWVFFREVDGIMQIEPHGLCKEMKRRIF